MTRHLLLAGLLLWGSQAVAQDDVIGVFADPAGTQDETLAIAGQAFDIYVVLLNASEPSGLFGYEVKLVATPNLTLSDWTYGAGANYLAAPEFLVIYPDARPRADVMLLASGRCQVDGTEPGYIRIAPMDPGSVEPPAPVYLPGTMDLVDVYVTMTPNALAPESPAFIVHNCSATGQWARESAVGPTARSNYAMAYDSQDEVVVLFGGHDGDYSDETWLWDGSGWNEVFPAHSPSARTAAAMVYDRARDRMVLFGGNNPNALSDTWEWDGSDWTQVATTGPGARFSMGFAYDSNRHVCVLYAGNHDAGRWADTWEWNGTTWSLRMADSPPDNRSFHAMAYDEDLQKVVLFGGQIPGGLFKNDTWTWDGTNWVQLAVSGPSARVGHGMTYESACGGIYLFGGLSPTTVLGDLWKFQGGAWTLVQAEQPQPGPRRNQQMIFDRARGTLMFFGGRNTLGEYDDTWSYGAPSIVLAGVDPRDPGDLGVPAVRIHSSYPNPFNPRTTIRFDLGRPGPVKLVVYDLQGRPVRTLFDGDLVAGVHELVWDGTDQKGARVASGAYLYRLTMAEGEYKGKMVLLK